MHNAEVFKRRMGFLLVAGVVVVLAFAVFIFGGPASVVNWSEACVVALESDDWGLAGFVPKKGLWKELDREVLKAGPSFPDVYWESTLEDSSMVAGLCAVLAKHQGNDGLPPVFQPNYVMSSLAWSNTGDTGTWHQYDLPVFPAEYARPGMWEAVRMGIKQGLWYPEYHAAWHYDPDMRRKRALANPSAQAITEAGILLFPGSEQARELGPWRNLQQVEEEFIHSLSVFEGIFGREPGSIIAPDYTWNDQHEQMWEDSGQVVIQAKREQRNPDYRYNMISRIRKVLSRRMAYVGRPTRTYLERNCRFEPVQSLHAEDAKAMSKMVDQTVEQTLVAWHKGQPAIVETHRVNFAHAEPEVVALGLTQLDAYLGGLLAGKLGKKAVFLVDTEIAQLSRQGTSICLRGEIIIIRNATHSRRIAVVPGEVFDSFSENGGAKTQNRIFLVGPGAILKIPLATIFPSRKI